VKAKQAATAAGQAGDDWIVKWLRTSARQLRLHQVLFAGRRTRPSRPSPSNWYYDAPPQLQDPPYALADQALRELLDFWHSGLGLDWDWSTGFPPAWPTSVWDRIHARAPITAHLSGRWHSRIGLPTRRCE
jgi:hypothetical protein